MTDPKKPNDLEFAFDDLDDMLGEWEQAVDSGKAKPESAPLPQSAADTAPPPPRPEAKPLYRPPSPSETARASSRAPEYHVGFDDDGDDDGATRIATIPRELIDSLLAKKKEDHPTAPPPPMTAPTKPPAAPERVTSPSPIALASPKTSPAVPVLDDVDWDLDALLSEPPPARTSSVPPGGEPKTLPPQATTGAPGAPSRDSILDMEAEEAFFAQVVPKAASLPTMQTPMPPPSAVKAYVPAPPPPSAFAFEDDEDDDEPAIEASSTSEDLDDEAFDDVAVPVPVASAAAVADEDDDDGPEMETSAASFDDDDDDEPVIETSSARHDDDDDDGPIIESSTVEAPMATKRAEERLLLVGDDPDALRAQKAMLLGIAESLRGTERAELLVSAAELADRAGDEDAVTLLEDALVADPRHLVALRRARRAAVVRGDHSETAKLLEREIALPLSPKDKANALAWLTELHLGPLADPGGALKHARLALAAAKGGVHAQMYVVEANLARGEDDDVAQSLEKIAEAADGSFASHAAIDAALHAEHRNQTKRARELADRALSISPDGFVEALHAARLRRADGDVAGAVAALGTAAIVAPPALEEHVRRARAVLALGTGTDLETAYASLERGTQAGTARLGAAIARALGDANRERASVEAWAERAKGADRTLALLRHAEITNALGAREASDTALRDAAVADPSFALVRVVRETIARRRGDAADSFATDENPLTSLGRAIVARADKARERSALDAARRTGESALLCDLLEGDLAAAAADADGARAAADRDATRENASDTLGPDLARAMLALVAGDQAAAGKTLVAATQGEHGLVALRLLGFARPTALEPLAMREAEQSVGETAAAAYRLAAALCIGSGTSPLIALERALDEHPTYAPAAFLLEELAQGLRADPADTLDRLRRAASSEASRTRLSLARASSDDTDTLLVAMDASPDDMCLRLMVATATGAPAPARARAASELASAAIATKRGLETVTAIGHAEGGSPSEAASIYRALREPLLERALEDAEFAAGEVARVAERRFQSVRDANDDRSRARALVALSDLDRHVRADYGSASLSLSGAREAAPDDVRILRALERHAMENDRTEALTELEAELARVVSDVPTASVHARLAMRLALEASPDDPQAADEILTAIAARGTTHITLLRAIEGLALERTDRPLLLDVLTKRAAQATTEPARVELALRIAELEEQLEGPGPSARTLKPASDALPSHPTAPEALALYLERAQDAHSAGEALEVASRAARVPGRVAALAYRAGVLWQEGARDFDRALACFERALSIDVAYLDAFERAASILTRREQFARLLALYDARIDAASEPVLLTKLLGQKATVAESLGDRSTARAALDRALSIEPDSPTALRRTGELALADEDYRSAADAFIRLARVRQDRDELHFIFMTLGDIYDRHTPDPRRAEASFRRVLKLVPTDKEALDRLIAVLLGQGLVEPAVEALAELVKIAPNDPRVRKHRLALAETYERVSDPRRAEQTLEELRRAHPTDLEIVTAIAELYRRENAQSALGMHLNRAAADYRKAIEERPADARLWHGLGQAYALRGRRDATRCVAASTFALGLPDVELAKLLDANGNIPGAGKSIREQEIEEQLCPRALPPAALSVFRLASEIFEKLMPFDAKAWRTEKIGGKNHPLRAEANRIAEWFGLSDVQVLVTGAAPRIFVPVSENPVTIVIGRELPATLDEAERTFLLVRSLEIAACGMSLAVRNQPREVAFAVHGLIRAFDPMHVADGADVAQLDKFANQITKLLGRKAKSDLGPLAIEMGGRAGFDAQRLGVSAAELGDRIALLSTGSLPSGLSALLKLAGREMPSNAPAPARVAAVRGMAESWGLVEFAASDAHFEARRLLGLDKV